MAVSIFRFTPPERGGEGGHADRNHLSSFPICWLRRLLALPLLRRELGHELLLVKKDAGPNHVVQAAARQEVVEREVLPYSVVGAPAVLPVVRPDLLGSRSGSHLCVVYRRAGRETRGGGGVREETNRASLSIALFRIGHH